MVRIAIVGCGRAARIHLSRLVARSSSRIVGCSDSDPEAAQALVDSTPSQAREGRSVPIFLDHETMLASVRPDVLAIFTPHLSHYRAAMDGLQAGCHVFVEKPLSTNPQEAVDIVRLAKGRGRIVAVGHQYRLRPSLIEARRRIAERTIGRLRMATAVLTQNWLADHQGLENSWRFDPRIAGGGILADLGDHLVDALLWTTGRSAIDVAAIQDRLD